MHALPPKYGTATRVGGPHSSLCSPRGLFVGMSRRERDPPPRAIDRANRVVLPPEVMAALGVKEGDHIGFRIDGKRVTLHKARWLLDE